MDFVLFPLLMVVEMIRRTASYENTELTWVASFYSLIFLVIAWRRKRQSAMFALLLATLWSAVNMRMLHEPADRTATIAWTVATAAGLTAFAGFSFDDLQQTWRREPVKTWQRKLLLIGLIGSKFAGYVTLALLQVAFLAAEHARLPLPGSIFGDRDFWAACVWEIKLASATTLYFSVLIATSTFVGYLLLGRPKAEHFDGVIPRSSPSA